ncbi:hypothetical protein BGZ92_004737, partial [Podila epicladia]
LLALQPGKMRPMYAKIVRYIEKNLRSSHRCLLKYSMYKRLQPAFIYGPAFQSASAQHFQYPPPIQQTPSSSN